MGYNLHGGYVLSDGKEYWVILSPERPLVGRLVFEDGQWFLVMGSTKVPVVLEGQPRGGVDELPEPDYDRFLSWCRRSVSEKTCREYVRYLQRFEWPLRREKLYEIELTKWHVLALRNYLRFLEEHGFSVDSWRRMRALAVPESEEDRYVPPLEDVRDCLPRLIPRYRLVYYVMLYTALRLEHSLRLLADWGSVKARLEPLPGSCVRIAPPPGWLRERRKTRRQHKRVFYIYMPRWLYDSIDMFLSRGYVVPRRDSVTKYAKEKGAPAPKYIRKFALDAIAELLGPDIAAHVAGHDPGAKLQRALPAVKTKTTGKRYVRLEDIAAEQYHLYAEWLEREVAPRRLLEEGFR